MSQAMDFLLGRLLAVILACLMIFDQCSGAAIALNSINNQTNTLIRRQCVWIAALSDWDCNYNLPSVNQIKIRMRDTNDRGGVTAEARAVFHTNLISAYGIQQMYTWILSWLAANQITQFYADYNSLSIVWNNVQAKWIMDHANEMLPKSPPDTAISIFGGCLSQALAEAAIHEDAYIFTKIGQEWDPKSTWASIELPILTAPGGSVKRIYIVDPRPPHQGGPQCATAQLWWDRDLSGQILASPAITNPFRCPVTEDG